MSEYNPGEFIHSESTLAPVIDVWNRYLSEQGKSVNTVKAFMGDMKFFKDYFSPDKTIGSVTTRDIENFLKWMREERVNQKGGKGSSLKSNSRRITTVKAFFRWLTSFGILKTNPADPIVQEFVDSPLPEILSMSECERALEAANEFRFQTKADPRPMTLLLLLLTTGLKKSETLAISRNHIDLEDPLHPRLHLRGTKNEDRVLPLPPAWLEIYDEYLAKYNPGNTVFPWCPRSLEYVLEDIGKRAGLTQHLSFDMCRWTCLVRDYVGGSTESELRQKAGVSTVQWKNLFSKIQTLAPVFREEA